MTKNALLAAVVGLVCYAQLDAADQSGVQRILDKYREVRPQADDLAIYELDWAPTLKAAQEEAAKQNRPIFLILVRNSFGNIAGGHC